MQNEPKWVLASRTIGTGLLAILLIALPMMHEGLTNGTLRVPDAWLPFMPWVMMFLVALMMYFRVGAKQSLTMRRPGKDKRDDDENLNN